MTGGSIRDQAMEALDSENAELDYESLYLSWEQMIMQIKFKSIFVIHEQWDFHESLSFEFVTVLCISFSGLGLDNCIACEEEHIHLRWSIFPPLLVDILYYLFMYYHFPMIKLFL